MAWLKPDLYHTILQIREERELDLIIGGGEYGNAALEKLLEENRPVTVIDEDLECKACQNHNLTVLSGNLPDKTPETPPGEEFPEYGAEAYFIKGGIKEAAKIILEYPFIERIFPTAPVHVSAGIIAETAGFLPDPSGADLIEEVLPQRLVTGRNGANIYCSLNPANICLKNCPEPPVCPVTKERRDNPLWAELEEYLNSGEKANGKTAAIVIPSRQYGPGLGYIKSSDIRAVINSAGIHDKLSIATACRCHGVITSLKRIPHEQGLEKSIK